MESGYTLGQYNSMTISQCSALCAETAGCAGFSIQCSDGVSCGSDPTQTFACSLKGKMGTSTINYNLNYLPVVLYQSQQSPIPGIDFYWNDIIVASGTYDQCIRMCLDIAECGMVEFTLLGSLTSTSVQYCNLKTVTNLGWGVNTGWQSFILPRSTFNGGYSMYNCLPCPAGYFADAGAGQCSLCQSVVAGVSPTVPVPSYHWTSPSGATRGQCVCQTGFTGTNCEFSACANLLPGASLGSMLFQADTKLRQFSANASAYAIIDVNAYLYNLLHVGIDVNGDGNITVTEMITALTNRLIYSQGLTQLPLWCRSAQVGAYCYSDLGGNFVEVSSVYNDAIANFNLTGTFDGSGGRNNFYCCT